MSSDLGGYPTSQITTAADKVVRQLTDRAPEAKVVLVSPMVNGTPSQITLDLSAGLQQVARRNDVAYVDATRWFANGGDLIGPDGVHPTDKGQRLLALRMQQALDKLGLVNG